MADSLLCTVCQEIDFPAFFVSELEGFDIGSLPDVLSRRQCPICCLIIQGLESAWPYDRNSLACVQEDVRIEVCSRFWAQVLEKDKASGGLETLRVRMCVTSNWIPGQPLRGYSHYTVAGIDLVEPSNPQPCDTTELSADLLIKRRMVPEQMNLQLVKHWISSCLTDHEERSPIVADLTNFGNAVFRVIDVEDHKIVQPSSCRYLALSYVWGDVMHIYSESATRDPADTTRLRINKLPRTIRDAIHLTKLLGERYLWIDWLCIDQADERDKSRLVYHMHSIYQHATVTIVAAAGNNAEAGLSGLYPGTRKVEVSTTIQCGSKTLDLVLARPSLEALLQKCVWSTRGWTYQEHVLSPRRLFFTSTEIFYTCSRRGLALNQEARKTSDSQMLTGPKLYTLFRTRSYNDWREAYSLESEARYADYCSEAPRKLRRPGWPLTADVRTSWNLDYIRDYTGENISLRFLSYAISVRKYTARKLSNRSDIVFAFAGVLQEIWGSILSEDQCNMMLRHGLPPVRFGQSLIWSSCNAAKFERRRSDVNGMPIFPSWSWAGWEGAVFYDITSSTDGELRAVTLASQYNLSFIRYL